jgi:hypothetical protein
MSIILAPISHIDPIGTSPLALDVIGNYAFYLDGPRDSGPPSKYTLTAIQINAPSLTNPTSPVIASFVDTGDTALGGFIQYCIQGDSYYVFDRATVGGEFLGFGTPLVFIFDISDPTAITLSDTLTFADDFNAAGGPSVPEGTPYLPYIFVQGLAPGNSSPVYFGGGESADDQSNISENCPNSNPNWVPALTDSPGGSLSVIDGQTLADPTTTCVAAGYIGAGSSAGDYLFGFFSLLNAFVDDTIRYYLASYLMTSGYSVAGTLEIGDDTVASVIALEIEGDAYVFVQDPEGTQTIYSDSCISVGTFDDEGQIRYFGGALYVGASWNQFGVTGVNMGSNHGTGTFDINVYDASDLTDVTQTDGPLFANAYPDGSYSNIQCYDVGTLLLYTIDQGPGDADVPQFEFSIWSLDGPINPGGGGTAPSATGSISIYDVTATPPALIQQIVGPSSSVAVQGREFYAGPAGGPNIFQYKWGGFYCSSVSTDELLVDGAAQIDILKAREGYFKGNVVCENLLAGSIMQVVAFEDPTADDIPTGAFVCWQNVNAGTVKIYANVFGSLVSVTLS